MPERSLELGAACEAGEHLDWSGDAPMEVLERELGIGVKPLDRKLSGRGVPAGAIPVTAVAPIVAEFERVAAPAGIGV